MKLIKQLLNAKKSDAPTIISCKTTIGFGSPNKSGSASSHGSPLGEDEISLTRKELEWNYAPFEIPNDLLDEWRNFYKRNDELKIHGYQKTMNKLKVKILKIVIIKLNNE